MLFGETAPHLFGGAIAIRGIAGDQQAATIGQACFTPGMMKSTYGTGCFALLNTGTKPVASNNKLLTTIAYQLGGKRTYALEGSIFVAGSAVQWLRDGLGIIKQAAETGPLADGADPAQEVYLVPAFVGLGAPYWNPNVRGALFGLTRNSGPKEFAKAALESVCYQTYDLWAAMRADWPDAAAASTVLRVDGGMTASDWTMQRLADLLDAPVDRPEIQETTALGAAYLAGLSRRRVSRAGALCRQLAAAAPFQAGDERGDARAQTAGLGEGRRRRAGERSGVTGVLALLPTRVARGGRGRSDPARAKRAKHESHASAGDSAHVAARLCRRAAAIASPSPTPARRSLANGRQARVTRHSARHPFGYTRRKPIHNNSNSF